jgi:hypothetical protein
MVRIQTEVTEEFPLARVGRLAGERALMLAVLEDGISCLHGEAGPARERRQLAAEARGWVASADKRWPFSFVNICEAVGFDADVLRSRLLRDAPHFGDDEETVVSVRARRPAPAEEDVVRMIREGHPLRVVAEAFGISVSKASILSCGLASRMKAERDDEIRRLRLAGWTHRALAAHFRLSRIRVMRICARRQRDERNAA